jgi:glucose-6-phosphate dehydrogenase assembly protein OpcA
MNAEPTRQDVLAVDIQTIEDEWARLWKESAATPANGGHPATRNSVLNLLVFTQRAATAKAVDSALDELCQYHPARVLLIVAQAEAPQPEMKAWINLSYYQQDKHRGPRGSEQVTIEARGPAVSYLPGVVLPLLAPHLPVFTWWADVPPVEQPIFERLIEVSDRVVIDSAEFETVGKNFQALARVSRSRQYRAAVSDLNWQRSAPWRELMAQFFDMAALQPYLPGISHMLIEYAGAEANGRTAGVSNPAQALLLVGWMASKLDWSVAPGEQKQVGGKYQLALRTHAGNGITVEIRPRAIEAKSGAGAKKKPLLIKSQQQIEEGEHATNPTWMVSQTVAGALSVVNIVSAHDGHTGVFSIRRSADLAHATTSCSIDGMAWGQERTVHLDSIGRSELMRAELEALGHDEDFEDALTIAGALAE